MRWFLICALGLCWCGCDMASQRQTAGDYDIEVNTFYMTAERSSDQIGEMLKIQLQRIENERLIYINFRKISAGEFIMGDDLPNRMGMKDAPRHRVILTKDYWLASTECTQLLWSSIMGQNPSRFYDSRHAYQIDSLYRPVEMVSWDDCHHFIRKLNKIADRYDIGYRFRLPTEAEWEYACQSGEVDESTGLPRMYGFPRYAYNEQGEKVRRYLADYARMISNSAPVENGKVVASRTWKVDERFPNKWGLYNMLGNVSEWCEDFCYVNPFQCIYTDTYKDGIRDPLCQKGEGRIIRGGAWDSLSGECRNAYRNGMKPEYKNCNLGFRLVAYEVVEKPVSALPEEVAP